MPSAVVVDIDNTLAILDGRNPYDQSTAMNDRLNTGLADKINKYHDLLDTIIVVTGRDISSKKITEDWLKENNIPYGQLLMSNEYNMSNVDKKKGYLLNSILPNYDVKIAFDDDPAVIKMYKQYGIKAVKV